MSEIRKILLVEDANATSSQVDLRIDWLAPSLELRYVDKVAITTSRLGNSNSITVTYDAAASRRARASSPCGDAARSAVIEAGDAAMAVLKIAAQRKTDLIVCRASDRPGWLEMFAPSRVAQISRASRAPVLLAHKKPVSAYRTVVVATDFSPASIAAAKTALALAPEAHFIFLHTYSLPNEQMMHDYELHPGIIKIYRERGRAVAQQRLEALLEYFAVRTQSSACAIEFGRPQQRLRDFARQNAADLVVVGKTRTPDAGKWSGNWSIASRISNRPDCDVLVGADNEVANFGRRRAFERLAGAGVARSESLN